MKTKLTRVEGATFKFFEKIGKTDLLILDDFGLTHLDRQQQLDLMEILEDRHAKKATIIASQLPVASWYDFIGEATICRCYPQPAHPHIKQNLNNRRKFKEKR